MGYLEYEDLRPWGSCFLQYLWEFVLGMWIAERYLDGSENRIKKLLMDPATMKWTWLIGCAIVGMGLTGMMAWNGGTLKLFNDVPSLLGYLSMSLIVYKLGCTIDVLAWIKRFFMWTSGFGYELYLVHSLVYVVMGYLLNTFLPLPMWFVFAFMMAYAIAWGYRWFLNRIIYKK